MMYCVYCHQPFAPCCWRFIYDYRVRRSALETDHLVMPYCGVCADVQRSYQRITALAAHTAIERAWTGMQFVSGDTDKELW